jgi:hypothetical protein
MYDIFPTYEGNTSWINHAPCRGNPVEWWHPTQGQSAVRNPEIRIAKKICSSCDYTAECLEFGIGTKSSGIYGGVTLRLGRVQTRAKKERK